MTFSKQIEDLMEFFYPHMEYFIKKDPTYDQRKLDSLFKLFYAKLQLADTYYVYLNIKDNIRRRLIIIKNKEEITKDSYLNSSFIPVPIKDYIVEHTKYFLQYTFKLFKRDITITFGLDNVNNMNKYDEYVRLMFLWLHMINSYGDSKCSKKLDINLYLTPFLKTLPRSIIDIISPYHVNSAVTTSCNIENKIVIFRQEEWFKVFIHETIHSYGLDFSSMDSSLLTSKLLNLFPVSSDMECTEMYSEFWAEIFNCVFCSYAIIKDKSNVEDFLLYCDLCLSFEQVFSLFQCVKILKHMNIRYRNLYKDDILSKTLRSSFYKENTNVFSYYILKQIVLYNASDFMNFCIINNNKNIVKFTTSNTNLVKLFKFIKDRYKNENMLVDMDKMLLLYDEVLKNSNNEISRKLLTTTRMSICEFDI